MARPLGTGSAPHQAPPLAVNGGGPRRLYLYAILDTVGEMAPGQPGLHGFPVRRLSHGQVGAAVSHYPGSRTELRAELALRHAEVVQALLARHTILPARYGTLLSGEEAVTAYLEEHQVALRRQLDLVRGRVEMSVRLIWNGGPVPLGAGPARPAQPGWPGQPGGPGQRYLLTRLARSREEGLVLEAARALAEELHDALGPLSAGRRLRLLATQRLPVSAAYLVDRERAEEFPTTLRALSTRRPELTFLCTGPWPPYSFATGPLEET